MGAILVALNIRLSSREIEFIINHSGAKVLVFDSEFAPMVRDIKDRIPLVTTFVQVVDIVEIGSGCLSACTFCQVKIAKGTIRSYPPDDIKTQIISSVNEGALLS